MNIFYFTAANIALTLPTPMADLILNVFCHYFFPFPAVCSLDWNSVKTKVGELAETDKQRDGAQGTN